MKVKFLETRRAFNKAGNLIRCLRGKEYDLADSSARNVVQHGWAIECELSSNRFEDFIVELRENKLKRLMGGNHE